MNKPGANVQNSTVVHILSVPFLLILPPTHPLMCHHFPTVIITSVAKYSEQNIARIFLKNRKLLPKGGKSRNLAIFTKQNSEKNIARDPQKSHVLRYIASVGNTDHNFLSSLLRHILFLSRCAEERSRRGLLTHRPLRRRRTSSWVSYYPTQT